MFIISEDHVDLGGRLQAKGANLRKVSDLEGSAKLLSYAIRANGLDPENWYQLALTHQKRGDLKAAESAYGRAVQLGELAGSVSFDATFNHGEAGIGTGPTTNAAAAIITTTSGTTTAALPPRHPDSPRPVASTPACMLQALNRTAEASETFQRAVEVGAPPGAQRQRKETDAQHNWGLTLLKMERYSTTTTHNAT